MVACNIRLCPSLSRAGARSNGEGEIALIEDGPGSYTFTFCFKTWRGLWPGEPRIRRRRHR